MKRRIKKNPGLMILANKGKKFAVQYKEKFTDKWRIIPEIFRKFEDAKNRAKSLLSGKIETVGVVLPDYKFKQIWVSTSAKLNPGKKIRRVDITKGAIYKAMKRDFPDMDEKDFRDAMKTILKKRGHKFSANPEEDDPYAELLGYKETTDPETELKQKYTRSSLPLTRRGKPEEKEWHGEESADERLNRIRNALQKKEKLLREDARWWEDYRKLVNAINTAARRGERLYMYTPGSIASKYGQGKFRVRNVSDFGDVRTDARSYAMVGFGALQRLYAQIKHKPDIKWESKISTQYLNNKLKCRKNNFKDDPSDYIIREDVDKSGGMVTYAVYTKDDMLVGDDYSYADMEEMFTPDWKKYVTSGIKYNPKVGKYEGKPPKEWFYYVVKQLKGSSKTPEKLAGWIWHHQMHPKTREIILKEIKTRRKMGKKAIAITAEYLKHKGKIAANPQCRKNYEFPGYLRDTAMAKYNIMESKTSNLGPEESYKYAKKLLETSGMGEEVIEEIASAVKRKRELERSYGKTKKTAGFERYKMVEYVVRKPDGKELLITRFYRSGEDAKKKYNAFKQLVESKGSKVKYTSMHDIPKEKYLAGISKPLLNVGKTKRVKKTYKRVKKTYLRIPRIPGMPKNPGKELLNGLKLYYKRHGKYPESITRENVPKGYPKVGVPFGKTPELIYKTPKTDGKSKISNAWYKHKFETPATTVTNAQGKGLFIVHPKRTNKGYKRWIED